MDLFKNPLVGLNEKNVLDLNFEERWQVADILRKENFSDSLQIPELPRPGEKNYHLLETIKTVNTTYECNKKADELWMKAMVTDSPEEYGPALIHLMRLMNQVNEYYGGLKVERLIVNTPENVEKLHNVRTKYFEADNQFFSQNRELTDNAEGMIDRVAMRLSYFEGTQFCLDLDKTLTQSDGYLNQLPHARQFENFIKKNGRASLPFVMARYAKEALLRLEEVYRTVGKSLKFRPGVEEFFENTKALGIPLSITSANFRVIVTSCLNQLPVEKRDHVLSIVGLTNNDISAIDKEVVTARRVAANPNLANFLAIDGLSDEGCLQGMANGISAGIFVLRGTDFVNKVKDTGQPYFEFSDFHEVNNIFEKILTRKKELS